MNRKEIEFTVNRKGEVTYSVKGVKGASCLGIADAFHELGRVVNQARTSEYFDSKAPNVLMQHTSRAKTEN